MKVLVCGGRAYGEYAVVDKALSQLKQRYDDLVIMQGGAPGADWLAREWARRNHVFCMNYPADWQKHGRAAGPIRNQQMLDEGEPDLVVAFSGGRGTADMIRRAKQAGVHVVET